MRAQINSRFATAQETADVLGVSTPRFRQLVRLADSDEAFKLNSPIRSKEMAKAGKSQKKSFWALTRVKSAKSKNKAGSKKRNATQKSRASGKRYARGKVSKAAR
jgi:hypothetical protein